MMNLRRVSHILGLVLVIIAGAELVPIGWGIPGREWRAISAFLVSSVIAGAVGVLLRRWGNGEGELYRREGVLIVVGSWVLASIAGAIPYVVSGVLPSAADALFETASGFTTTGATVIRDIEAAGRAVLFWRSFTQWLGGIGIVVLFVALLSELGPGARFLFKLEVPGPKAEVLHVRVRDTALALARIYLVISLAEVGALMLAGLGLFDALTHTFSTLSTGGFSPHSESIGLFSPTVQFIVLVFMLASGVNFSLYHAMSRHRNLEAFRDSELRFYLVLTGLSILAVTLSLLGASESPSARLVLDAAFQVVSIFTTTGFSTVDFSQWPALARSVLVATMIVGGCAGSTAGGIKVIRAIIGWKAAMREVRLTYSPNSVIAVAVGPEAVPEESVRSVVSLLLLWFGGWGVGTVLLAVGGFDMVTAATAAIATLSNVGPGLASVGPLGDFSFFAPWQKLVMVLLMWLGRLEFFALLALLQPQFWRR